MDSIFEEEADEVGGEIEAYCPSPRCKAATTHTIISMYEDEVRRVQCVVCGEVHAYRKPRGDGEGGDGEGGKKNAARRMTWDEAMSRATDTDLGNCRPYSIRDTYEDGDVVYHPVFDIGFVVAQLPDSTVEVLFRDGGAREEAGEGRREEAGCQEAGPQEEKVAAFAQLTRRAREGPSAFSETRS